jgi:hypothetical protein
LVQAIPPLRLIIALTKLNLLKSLVRTPEMLGKAGKDNNSMPKNYCKNTFSLSFQLPQNLLIWNLRAVSGMMILASGSELSPQSMTRVSRRQLWRRKGVAPVSIFPDFVNMRAACAARLRQFTAGFTFLNG